MGSSQNLDQYASQKSALINLQAGKRYYIEALHKESNGGDNLAVGWKLPNTTAIAVIAGAYLSPYSLSNTAPVVTLTAPVLNATFTQGSNITISANATDNGGVEKVEFYNGTVKLGEVDTFPYNFTWNSVAVGTYNLTAKAIDNLGETSVSAVIPVSVLAEVCSATGSILREYWANISGTAVSDIPVNIPPATTSQLNIFEAPSNVANSYGQRITGYICVPLTGNYTFYIAADNNAELWLSTSENPANKIRIAHITGSTSWTNAREWSKFSTQKSGLIALMAGKKYYIEALHKENSNGDNLAVGWTLPNGTLERPIQGNRLSPYSFTTASTSVARLGQEHEQAIPIPMSLEVYANPSLGEQLQVEAAGLESKSEVKLMVYNSVGTIIVIYFQKASKEGNINKTLSFKHKLPPGVYTLNLQSKNQTLRRKIVVIN